MAAMRWLSQLIAAFTSEDRAMARCIDPDFGEMWRNTYDVWRADIVFPPTGDKVALHFYDAGSEGPTQWQRSLYYELVGRYAALREAMAEPLWREYEEIRTSWKLASESIGEPKEIWRIAYLFAIEINEEGAAIEISLDHGIDWENEDHDLNVRLIFLEQGC